MKSSQPCSRAWAASNTHVVAHRIPTGDRSNENGDENPVYTQKQVDSLRKNDDEVDLLRKNDSNGCFFLLFQCNTFGNKWLASRFTGILFFKQTHIDERCHDYVILLGGRKPRFPRNEAKRAAAMSSSLDADSLKNWLHLTIRNPWPHQWDPLGFLTYSITCLMLLQRFTDLHLTTFTVTRPIGSMVL